MTDPLPSTTCPDCGAPLSADSPQTLCPACLMRQALISRTVVHDDAKISHLPPPSPEEIADKFPGYEILECLGRGGMGVVYKARQKSLNRLVAIKILAPERVDDGRFAERFTIEAELLAKLSHPHIVTIHDFGETAGLFYLVMEFIDGVNLRDLLRDGKLEPQQALAIVPPVCDALQYAHDKGIVHRDIKPENILLDREGRVKIADFGIAKLIGNVASVYLSSEALAKEDDRRWVSSASEVRRSQTAATINAGTIGYSAPEQSHEPQHVDQRADIYSLGVVLYEMLTGERPNKDLVAPSKRVQIDVRLDEIVLRALEKTPELRYQTAGEFRTVLETMAQSSRSPDIKPESPLGHSLLTPSPANRNARFWHFASPGAFLLAYAGLLLLLATTTGLLPLRVASHFGAEGKVDGWMNRASYLVIMGCMPLLFGGVAVLISWLTHRLPARFINIPRRDFWLTPERRPEVAGFLRRRMFGLAVLMTAHFAGLHLLTVHANQFTPARLSLDGLLALVIAILLALLIWTVFLLMRLAEVEKPLPRPSVATPAVPPSVSSVKRPTWPIWLTFGIHALMLVGLAAILMIPVQHFMAMIRDLESEIPLLTRLVIGTADFTMRGGYLLVPVFIAMNLPLCWLADRLGGRKLLTGWAVLGVLVFLGLGILIVGSIFLTTSRLIGSVAETETFTISLPAECAWQNVEIPALRKERWESGGTDQALQPVVDFQQPKVAARRYAVIGEIKYENVEATAYLEMWSHFLSSGKYFTRTLGPTGSGPMAVITGSSDWRPFTLPFDRGNTTDSLSKIEVNLCLPAKGVVHLRGLRLVEDVSVSIRTER